MVAALAGSGCATLGPGEAATTPIADGAASPLTWPPPPAPARIRFVKSVERPKDLGVRLSWWRRIPAFLLGSPSLTRAFVKPCGVAFDDSGDLCMTDTGSGIVFWFDRENRRFRCWEEIGGMRFVSPVAVAKQGDRIFVADTVLGKILVFTEKGKFEFEISEEILRPAGLTIHGDRLLVADAKRHQVLIFDLDGAFIAALGSRGEGPGQFNFPTRLTTDSQGHLYVTDSMNFRAQIMHQDGTFIREFGVLGDGSGHFNRPKGIAIDPGGHVYLVDALFDNVQVFDTEGRFLMHWGRAGTGPGEFWLPGDMAISSGHEIAVADSYNGRIQIFEYLATP